MNKFILLSILLLSVMSLAACAGAPALTLETTNLSLGDVVNGEIANHDVMVKNTGSESLVVESVSTSCGCTTATLEPLTIEPGASGVLHIELDSGAHGPELTGPLVRQVFITSNDPQQPEAQVELTVNILPRP